MEIRILPSNIANMIAAGEVVTRPASVVKELMENAVDAGADMIRVVIRDSGRTLIQVIDNGCGMSPDEAVLCFERHATSKISSAEDLMDIGTFGFRGEALPSIAAVAQVSLKTRREEDEVGCEVVFADSKHVSTEAASVPKGSNFMVRDLFYNIPARRKFLKSDNVEFRHIVSEFTRVALTRPEVGFTLTHNDRDVYVLKPAKSLKFRIQDLLGTNVANEIVDIDASTSVAHIYGFAGRPDLAKKSLGNQFFFVNGRYFKSPYLHKAVMKAYENLIPEGVTPSYFIYMDVNPHAIDVNVSPTKTEIKFEDDSVIFQVLYACIKETLGRNSFGHGIDFDVEGAPQLPVFSKKFDEFRQISEPQFGKDPTYNPFDNDGFPSEPESFRNSFQTIPPDSIPEMSGHGSMQELGSGIGQENGSRPYSSYTDVRQDYGKLFEDKILPSKAVLVIRNRFILTSVKSGVMAIHIRRARERILYDQFLEAISRNGHITQTALFPVQIQVGVEGRLILEEHSGILSAAGFDIRPLGNDTVAVGGVPEGCSAEPGKVQVMVSDLITALSDDHFNLQETMESTMAERFAKIGATGDDRPVTAIEAQRLIDSLFACSNPEFTSSGHRTMAMLSAEELENMFK